MGPVTAIRVYLTHWLDFSGRARRFEIFWYSLFHIAMLLILTWVLVSTGNDALSPEPAPLNSAGQSIAILALTFGIFSIIATTALIVRRFHDMGYTGWLILPFVALAFAPVLGAVAYFGLWIWLCVGSGKVGTNMYGPDPRYQIRATFD